MWRPSSIVVLIMIAFAPCLRGLAQEVFDFPDVAPTVPLVIPEGEAGKGDEKEGEDDPQLVVAMQQLKPVLVVELSFAKRAASLDDQQVEQLVAAMKPKFKEVARQYLNNNNHLNGVVFFGNRPRREESKDPRQTIVDEVATQIVPIAREDQLEAFKREVEARKEFRKQAALDRIVVLYDEALVLAPEQRKKVRDSLEKHFEPSWADNVEALGQFSQGYYPMVPDLAVTPHLSDDQRRVWQRMQKVSASVGIGNNMWGSATIDDIDLGKDFIPQQPQVEPFVEEGIF